MSWSLWLGIVLSHSPMCLWLVYRAVRSMMHYGMSNVDGLLIHLALSALTSSKKIGAVGLDELVKNKGGKVLGVVRDAIAPQVVDLKDVLLLLREKGANVVVAFGEG